jgi:hypothetical protein
VGLFWVPLSQTCFVLYFCHLPTKEKGLGNVVA